MLKLIHIKEALRMNKRRRNFTGFRKFSGNANQICRKSVESCWNKDKKYFMISSGHFSEFYTRDFAWCISSLLKLGYKKEVEMTLRYALKKFYEHGKITTTISPDGKCFDFPTISPDSIASILYCLVFLDKRLINEYKEFLEEQIQHYYDETIDKKTGLIKKDKVFSEMRDYAKRKSSLYNNVMAQHTYEIANDLGLKCSFKNIKNKIKKEFWNNKERYFYEDLTKKSVVSGDTNVVPFYTGLFNDKKMIKSALNAIKINELNKPFLLKYSKEHQADLIMIHVFSGGYEKDQLWGQLGLMYLSLVKKHDKKEFNRNYNLLKKAIEKHGTFLEVFDKDGNPLKTKTYMTDEAMLWASMFLTL